MRTTRMVVKALGSAVAAVSLSLLLAGGAWSKPVLQEDFMVQPPGMHGGEIVDSGQDRGWRGPGGDRVQGRDFVEYPLAGLGLNPEKGTIEFTIARDEVSRNEAAFSLMDKSGNRLFVLRFNWGSYPGGPVISTFTANTSEATAPAFWYVNDPENANSPMPRISIGKTVAKGQKIHVALTWNGTAGNIYVDGASLNVKTDPGAPFSALVAAADRIIVGAEFDNRIPEGAWSVSHSVISRFQFNSEALTVAELDGPILQSKPVVASVEHDAARVAGFSGKLVAGNSLTVTSHGTPGKVASFDIAHYPEIGGKITLDWRGWGVYLEEKVFYEEGEVNLRDVEGYKVYASTSPFDPAVPGMEPVAELEAGVQSYTFEYLTVDTPYYLAAVALMRDGTTKTVVAPLAKLPMAETEPGLYVGSYKAGWQDRYPRAVIVGRLESPGGAATQIDTKTITIEPDLNIAVATEPSELKADEVSKASVAITVTDANGNPVSGHKMKVLLATTSQYTGVVGGGDFTDQVGGSITEDRWLETDLFGRLEVKYVAGFAAKTAIIVARDMLSNSTGAGYVKTFITATAQLELLPAQATMDIGYEITVSSSDEWLTADGKSQARITAKVSRFGNPVEGHTVDFSVSSGTGSIRVVKDTTDRNGEARAVYTAGKKIGLVLITATDTNVGISGTVSIELRSDAPAKIVIKLVPEKLLADGNSRADLSVLVTDINDNPNDNTEVEYAIASGGGKLRYDKGLTDRKGENANEYTAGNVAGTVTFDITVRSTTPTEDELIKARDLAVTVTDYKFF